MKSFVVLGFVALGMCLAPLAACDVASVSSEDRAQSEGALGALDAGFPFDAAVIEAGGPTWALTPEWADFGTVPIGTASDPMVFSLQNTFAAAEMAGVAVTGPFVVVSDQCTGNLLAPLASCTFSIEFAPQVEGSASGRVLLGAPASQFEWVRGTGGARCVPRRHKCRPQECGTYDDGCGGQTCCGGAWGGDCCP
jgi:hypothetical protein